MKTVINILICFSEIESDLSCDQAEMKFQFRYKKYQDLKSLNDISTAWTAPVMIRLNNI